KPFVYLPNHPSFARFAYFAGGERVSILDLLREAKERREKRIFFLIEEAKEGTAAPGQEEQGTSKPRGEKSEFAKEGAEVPPTLQDAKEAQEAKEAGSTSYASPWPDRIEGLGPRRVIAYSRCGICRDGTWVAFGDNPRCLPCALRGR